MAAMAQLIATRYDDVEQSLMQEPVGLSGDSPRRYVDVANGTIKRLVRDRGFGFIRDDGGQEWFFHRSAVQNGSFDHLNEGERVSFDEEPSAKAPRAANVRGEAADADRPDPVRH